MKLTAILAAPTLLTLSACTSTPPATVSESYIQTADGALLHYRKLDGGPKTLVVLGEALFSPDMDRLAKGRTLIYYDLRNRGRSGRADKASLDQDLQDLQVVLDWFRLERVTLLGFDYQAALAALYAERHPERVERLVLISPMPARKFPYWNIYERVFNERVDHESFRRLREMKAEGVQRTDPQVWSDAYRDTIASGWVVDMRSLRNMKATPLVAPNLDPEPLFAQHRVLIGRLGDWDWSENLTRVACPALVVTGDADPNPRESTAEWSRGMPGGVEHIFEQSCRLPWLERQAAFFEVVEPFIAG